MKTFEIISHGSETPILEGKIDLQGKKAQRRHETAKLEDK
jgi:hypothetical protein